MYVKTALTYRVENLHGIPVVKRTLAGQHVKEGTRKCPYVSLDTDFVVFASQHLLRRHVVVSTLHVGWAHCPHRCADNKRDAEVCNYCMSSLGQQNVLRLEVAHNDVSGVQLL